MRPLFFGAHLSEFEQTFPPRFRSRARLFALSQDKQGCRSRAEINVITGRKFLQRLEKTVFVSGIENLCPLQILLAREKEWNRFIVRVDQKKKSVVAHRLASLIDQVVRVPTEDHAETT